MTADVARIPFHGSEILSTQVEGKTFVAFRPMAESLGIDPDSQRAKLKGKHWAVTAMIAATGRDGKTYEMLAIDTRTTLMWLATINVSKVRPEARELLEAYQSEVADALEAYWTQGAAINPRASDDQLAKLAGSLGESLRASTAALEGLAPIMERLLNERDTAVADRDAYRTQADATASRERFNYFHANDEGISFPVRVNDVLYTRFNKCGYAPLLKIGYLEEHSEGGFQPTDKWPVGSAWRADGGRAIWINAQGLAELRRVLAALDINESK